MVGKLYSQDRQVESGRWDWDHLICWIPTPFPRQCRVPSGCLVLHCLQNRPIGATETLPGRRGEVTAQVKPACLIQHDRIVLSIKNAIFCEPSFTSCCLLCEPCCSTLDSLTPIFISTSDTPRPPYLWITKGCYDVSSVTKMIHQDLFFYCDKIT